MIHGTILNRKDRCAVLIMCTNECFFYLFISITNDILCSLIMHDDGSISLCRLAYPYVFVF